MTVEVCQGDMSQDSVSDGSCAKCLNPHLSYKFAHTCDFVGDFLVGVLTPPLRLPATGAAAPLARKLRVNYGLGISGAWIRKPCALEWTISWREAPD